MLGSGGDAIDEMLAELRAIRQAVGGDSPDGGDEYNIGGFHRPINSRSYLIVETADMDNANADGSVTVPAGESADMVEFSVPDGYEIRVYAAGANDATKVQYKLTIDDDHDLGGSWQESPLGSILAPWSFTAYSGGYIRARQSIRYHARNIGSDPQDVGARLHLEVVPVEE